MKARFYHFIFLVNLIGLLAACQTTDNGLPAAGTDNSSLKVSREVYDRTFDEIRAFLKKIHQIIVNRDFNSWQANCTAAFLALYSDPARLNELSQKPNLRDHHIVLASLSDYFLNVFIPSRSETSLEKIDFIATDRVKAITIVDGVPYVVYLLERDQNDQWKIGIW